VEKKADVDDDIVGPQRRTIEPTGTTPRASRWTSAIVTCFDQIETRQDEADPR